MRIKAKDLTIRMALSSDAGALDALTKPAFGNLVVDWRNATNDWIVAEFNGQIIGCIQLCMGRPVGRLELLCVDNTLDARSKHVIMMELLRSGLYALQQTGSQIVTAFIEFTNKGVKRIFKKRFGAQITNSGNLLTMYLGAL